MGRIKAHDANTYYVRAGKEVRLIFFADYFFQD